MEAAQQYLQQPVYTLDLQTDGRGTLEFGLVDHPKHKGALIEAKVDNTTSSWTVDSITLSAGKAKITQTMLFGTLLVWLGRKKKFETLRAMISN